MKVIQVSYPSRKQIIASIEKTGPFIQKVWLDDQQKTPVLHTVGVQEMFGFPEVVVIGLNPIPGMSLLLKYQEMLYRNGIIFVPGKKYTEFLYGVPVCFEYVDPDYYKEYMACNVRLYPEDSFLALQMIYPTPNGIWPWEEAAPDFFKTTQPLLFHHR